VTLANGQGYTWGTGTALIGNSTTDFIAAYTSGTEVLRIDSAGKVGIGNTTPNAKLHVKDSVVSTGVGSTSSPILVIQNERPNTGSSSAGLRFDTNEIGGSQQHTRATIAGEYDDNLNINGRLLFGTADSSGNLQERMRIDSAGKVGIGLSPSYALDIKSTDPNYQMNMGDGTNGYRIGRSTSTGLLQFYGQQSTYTGYVFGGVDGERMRIASDGNVGIGTSSPKRPLQIHTAGSVSNSIQLSNSATGDVADKGLIIGQDSSGDAVIYQSEANALKIYTSEAERLRVTASGNVGIGTSNPETTFQLGQIGCFGQDVNSLYIGGNFSSTGGGYLKSGNYAIRQFINTATGNYSIDTAVAGTAGSTIAWSEKFKIANEGEMTFTKNGVGDPMHIGGASNHCIYRVGGNGSGIHFSTNAIMPANASGTADDGVENLGSTGQRWKDLYLSGGIHLGGTGTANKLDDYEEGNWTPAFVNIGTGTYSIQTGGYTKIGNLVHCHLSLAMSSIGTASGAIVVSGMPFASIAGHTQGGHAGLVQNMAVSRTSLAFSISASQTSFSLKHSIGVVGLSSASLVSHSDFGATGEMYFSFSYRI
jgi:hypothetical protein